MTTPVLCGAESTLVHTALHRPLVGALICVALAAGGYTMIGGADQFGGCGEVGGELYAVTNHTPDQTKVCAVKTEPPVPLVK